MQNREYIRQLKEIIVSINQLTKIMEDIMKKHGLLLIIAIISIYRIQAKEIKIPNDYATIQEGINNSSKGDTVLVSPGTYFENIYFRGKNITVTSNYIKSGSVDDIKNTIIDGSKPKYADSASCVFFCDGEDSTAVIEGFTITKGRGTRYQYPNGWFREGGGVFVNNAAPTIKHNLIIGNEVLNTNNVTNAGGGGIRSNLGTPHIYNNVITLNKALFGAAIVIDLSGGYIKNNIIYANSGAINYGGGGAMWIYGPDKTIVIENNTIVSNSIGGLFFQAIQANVSNNIIWANEGYQINSDNGFGATKLTVKNNNIQGGYANNFSQYPMFKDSLFLLQPSSPVIDGGIDDILYNDIENKQKAGNAIFPSQGKVRNDIGAYGGPGADYFPMFEYSNISINSINFGFNNIVDIAVNKKLTILNNGTSSIRIDSIKKSVNSKVKFESYSSKMLMPLQTDTLAIEWTPQDDIKYADTLLIYHNQNGITNPLKASMTGKTKTPEAIKGFSNELKINIYPNPIKESAMIEYKISIPNSTLNIFDLSGKVINSVKISNYAGMIILNRNELSSGIYLYSLNSGSSVLTGKFIVE
jgi:hypothetical protein